MINKFTGEKCIVCGELFEDGQDIVVCPDCGTPYHKDCWTQKGECINTNLHEAEETWKPSPKVTYTSPDPGHSIRCIRCGSENEPGKRFCGDCGLPLNFSREDPRPFNNDDSFNTSRNNGNTDFTPFGGDNMEGFMPTMHTIKLTPQSDMDGIKLGDLVNYIGGKSLNLIASFVRFAKTGQRISLNIAALFIPDIYFFYRKMYKTGVIYMLLLFLLSIPSLIYDGQSGTMMGMVLFTTPIDLKSDNFLSIVQLCNILIITLKVFAASYANYWYYKKAREDITSIRTDDIATDEEAVKMIRVKGGTSWSSLLFAGVTVIVLQLGFLLGLSLLYR